MFKHLKNTMQQLFAEMVKNQQCLFITSIDKDQLWDTYLNSYIDPVLRQEHNCSHCRGFIKNYGNVVAVRHGSMITLWDFVAPEEFRDTVKAMRTLVINSVIRDIFISPQAKIGVDSNIERTESGIITWEHFSLTLPKKFINDSTLSIESVMGMARDNKNVFQRSLEEISLDAIETVLELIAQNSLYRGEEWKGVLTEFHTHKREYDNVTNKDNYCWVKAQDNNTISRIRNTSIGTLLVDISEGKELDVAVSAFERMVAPANYKRPAAIITKQMVESAEASIEKLGYTQSLGRRLATADDILITNLLFVDRDSKKKSGIFEELKEEVIINPKSFNKVEEVTIAKFVKDILPTIQSISVLFENNHLSNLMTVITAKDKEAPILFKWNNPFSWSYTNAVTDSIKEQVKAAGGRVEGELRVSLSWFNYDDLDLHVKEPNGNEIYFGNKHSRTGGILDVDMNAGSGQTRKAVENIIWPSKTTMLEGRYKVMVHNFAKRENKDVGFAVEIEQNGEIYPFERSESLRDGHTVVVAEFDYTRKGGVVFVTTTKSNVVSKEKWGLATNKFQKVSMLMHSPNHWDGAIGNKHFFFILEGAKSDETPRGFFNEFLKQELLTNKRVFEVLGGKLKVEPAEKELSGLGFSSTQRNSLICKIQGKFERFIKINF